VHLNPIDGSIEVFSTPDHPTPYVYFLRTPGPPEVCQPKTPLTYRNISVYRIQPGDSFDLDTWTGHGGISYTLSAETGVLISSRGDIY
jgi:cyanophycinase